MARRWREGGADLSDLGSPLSKIDFNNYNASLVKPLELKIKNTKLFNLPPPTQGLASILILGLLDELSVLYKDDVDFIHTIVEATKVVFKMWKGFYIIIKNIWLVMKLSKRFSCLTLIR